jgi:lipopolysaccharide export system protein LptC
MATTLTSPSGGSLLSRRRRRFMARSRHSRTVGVLKLVLPSIAVGLVLLLVVWSQVNLDEKRFRIGLTDLAPEEIDSVNVVNARYEGIDKQDRPFTVTAAHAVQVDKDSDIIDLTDPRADITLGSGAWVAVSADTGRFVRKGDLLDLRGSVSLFHDRGFEFHADTVRINLKDSSAVSHDPVAGQGPDGHVSGQGIEVSKGGDRILILGRAKLVLYPAQGEAPVAGIGDVSE